MTTFEFYLLCTYFGGWIGSSLWLSVTAEKAGVIKREQQEQKWETGMFLSRPAMYLMAVIVCTAWPYLLVQRFLKRRERNA